MCAVAGSRSGPAHGGEANKKGSGDGNPDLGSTRSRGNRGRRGGVRTIRAGIACARKQPRPSLGAGARRRSRRHHGRPAGGALGDAREPAAAARTRTCATGRRSRPARRSSRRTAPNFQVTCDRVHLQLGPPASVRTDGQGRLRPAGRPAERRLVHDRRRVDHQGGVSANSGAPDTFPTNDLAVSLVAAGQPEQGGRLRDDGVLGSLDTHDLHLPGPGTGQPALVERLRAEPAVEHARSAGVDPRAGRRARRTRA